MPFRSILSLALMSAVALLPHSDFSTTLTFYTNEPSCCHAATSERRRIRLKADYYYIALRGASIRRSQRGNSEAIVGVAVRYTSNILQQVGGNTTKSSRGVAFFLQWRFCEIPTSQNSLLGILAKGVNRKDSGSAEDIYECVKCCLFAKQAIYLNTTLQSL